MTLRAQSENDPVKYLLVVKLSDFARAWDAATGVLTKATSSTTPKSTSNSAGFVPTMESTSSAPLKTGIATAAGATPSTTIVATKGKGTANAPAQTTEKKNKVPGPLITKLTSRGRSGAKTDNENDGNSIPAVNDSRDAISQNDSPLLRNMILSLGVFLSLLGLGLYLFSRDAVNGGGDDTVTMGESGIMTFSGDRGGTVDGHDDEEGLRATKEGLGAVIGGRKPNGAGVR